MAERFQVRRTYPSDSDREDHISYITAGGEERFDAEGNPYMFSAKDRALEVLTQQDQYATKNYGYPTPTYELTEAPDDGPNPPQGSST